MLFSPWTYPRGRSRARVDVVGDEDVEAGLDLTALIQMEGPPGTLHTSQKTPLISIISTRIRSGKRRAAEDVC
jgi:hypothetical protein